MLPPDPGPQARAWLEATLNGSPRTAGRVLGELATTRRVGTIAQAGAMVGAQLRRPLPGRTRSALEALRLACDRRLRDPSLVGTRAQAVSGLVQILVASVREQALAEEMTAAVEALLVNAGTQPPCLVVLGRQHAALLPVPAPDTRWAELARSYVSAGYEEDLEAVWDHEPDALLTPTEGEEALVASLQTCPRGADSSALWAFTRWAVDDARRRRARGVRGNHAFVTIAEPRLHEAGLSRIFILRETPEDVTVRCDWADERRTAVRLPRAGEAWPGWASSPGGALLVAYIAGAYRDMVVPLDVAAFAEHQVDSSERPGALKSQVAEPVYRLQPTGYIPVRRRSETQAEGERQQVSRQVAPHGVAWYIRRVSPGQHASAEALARAAAIGMDVPPQYTFVDAHVWPRSADPRSAATALRTTAALSALRAIVQVTQ